MGMSINIINGGIQNGWFIVENPDKKWMITGSTPISGNGQVNLWRVAPVSLPEPRHIVPGIRFGRGDRGLLYLDYSSPRLGDGWFDQSNGED